MCVILLFWCCCYCLFIIIAGLAFATAAGDHPSFFLLVVRMCFWDDPLLSPEVAALCREHSLEDWGDLYYSFRTKEEAFRFGVVPMQSAWELASVKVSVGGSAAWNLLPPPVVPSVMQHLPVDPPQISSRACGGDGCCLASWCVGIGVPG